MTIDRHTLYDLLPAIVRHRDAERGGPLADLLALLAEPLAHLDEDLRQRYDDLFIETCAPWVVPYHGDLVGARPRRGRGPQVLGLRAEVARTIAYRRRKGTALALAQLARDLTGWPAHVVVARPRLAHTASMIDPRPDRPARADLRARPAPLGRGPFDAAPRVADLRATSPHALDAVALYLWRLGSAPLRGATPRRLADGLVFTFDPAGLDRPLFARDATTAYDDLDPPPPHAFPAPITRVALHADPRAFIGPERSLLIALGGAPIPVDRIDVGDLSGDPERAGPWPTAPRPGRVLVDPERGRFALAEPPAAPLTVDLHHGQAAPLGGGAHERGLAPLLADTRRVDGGHGLAEALRDAPSAVEIADSRTYAGDLTLDLAAGADFTLRAADRERPFIDGALTVRAGPGATLTLDGLLLAGPLRVDAGLGRLVLRECTLLPRGDAPALIADPDGLALDLDRSIVGPLRLSRHAELHAALTIIDAGGPRGLALAAPAGGTGGAATLDRVTVIGRVDALSLDVRDSILHAEADPRSPEAPVIRCERRQIGALRHTYAPLGAQVPRRYACLPAADDPDLRPAFTSLVHGAPGYAQLARAAPLALRTGAADEAEPGAHHDLFTPHLEHDLHDRLAEHLPAQARAVLVFLT